MKLKSRTSERIRKLENEGEGTTFSKAASYDFDYKMAIEMDSIYRQLERERLIPYKRW